MKGVGSYLDRHGNRRWRLRRDGKSFSLPGGPDHPGFQNSYVAAVDGMRPRDVRTKLIFTGYFKTALRQARNRATVKRVAFSLDQDTVEQILEQQNWCCAVSGIEFDGRRTTHAAFRPSIDRIEPRKGYVADNVRIVCKIVNLAMSDWGSEPLLKVARAIADKAKTA